MNTSTASNINNTKSINTELIDSNTLPNAITEFNTIQSIITNSNSGNNTSKQSSVSLFLDYDGTLTPIVSDPAAARITPAMINIVSNLSTIYNTSIVTGRSLSTITDFLQLNSTDAAISYAASHGFHIQLSNSAGEYKVADSYLPALNSIYTVLKAKLQSIEGILIEDNYYSLSIHYRNVKSITDQQLIESVIDKELLQYNTELIKTHGKMVYEIRPAINWNKGKAVEYILKYQQKQLLDSNNNTAAIIPICIGDDLTDEDMFRSLLYYNNSISILVTSGKDRLTAAKYTLESVEQVGELLQLLAKL